jgi:hypothetical protein
MICGMTIGFLLVLAIILIVVCLALGALIAIVGIENQRKLEQQGGQMTDPRHLPGFPNGPGPPPR